jgi:predicted amidohydrolase YtcJ
VSLLGGRPRPLTPPLFVYCHFGLVAHAAMRIALCRGCRQPIIPGLHRIGQAAGRRPEATRLSVPRTLAHVVQYFCCDHWSRTSYKLLAPTKMSLNINQAVFTNGRFFTIANGKDAEFKQCMVIKGDAISYIGSEDHDTVSAARNQGAELHDLQGRTVLPGFIDSHVHILLMGESLQHHSLEQCKSLEDIRSEISHYATSNPQLPRIVCRGWMHIMTEGKADAVMLEGVDNRPIYVISKDLHSCWCSTAALNELDIQEDPDWPGGHISRDDRGKPSGLVSEAMVFLVFTKLTQWSSLSNRMVALSTAISELRKSGYTGLVDMATDELIWEGLLALREAQGGSLPMRIACHWLISPKPTEGETLVQVHRAIELHKGLNLKTSPDLRITGIKIITDGVIDACTAALHVPYGTTGAKSDTLWTSAQLEPVIRLADSRGLQCALHAIGDAAISLSISALTKHGRPGMRHRIEHLELTNLGDAARLAEAGITASIQPVHSDPAILRYWSRLLGPDRCKRAFAYSEFVDAKADIAMGSDSPTAPWDPVRNIYTATTRRSAREPELKDTVNERFKIELCQAVAAATAGGARACFADEMTGRLEVGLKADFVVVDMQWRAEELLKARVEQTWFGGRKVFDVMATSNGVAEPGEAFGVTAI